MVGNFKSKVDQNVMDVTVGEKRRQLLEIISSTVKKAHKEANIPYDESEIEKFVNENCFIGFVFNNVPYRFFIKS